MTITCSVPKLEDRPREADNVETERMQDEPTNILEWQHEDCVKPRKGGFSDAPVVLRAAKADGAASRSAESRHDFESAIAGKGRLEGYTRAPECIETTPQPGEFRRPEALVVLLFPCAACLPAFGATGGSPLLNAVQVSRVGGVHHALQLAPGGGFFFWRTTIGQGSACSHDAE